jgi:N-acetylglucosaminyldiphosphoundecaprenol N-acetyl-beta-D-mannosaminyltransferase
VNRPLASPGSAATTMAESSAPYPDPEHDGCRNVPCVHMFGCRIDNLTMDETVGVVAGLVRTGKPHQHVVVNVDKVIKADRDPDLRRIINACPLVNVDGMPIVWASYLLGKPLKQRVAGIDLFTRLMDEAPARGWRIFLLGAKEDVVTDVRRLYEARHPQIQIVGHRNGFWTAEEEPDVARQIADARPHLLFVAISSPKKEQFLDRYQPVMQVPFAMGVGGSFDVVSGRVPRAPLWMQRNGLEWFHRFAREPRRMFRRYFVEGMAYVPMVVREFLRRH